MREGEEEERKTNTKGGVETHRRMHEIIPCHHDFVTDLFPEQILGYCLEITFSGWLFRTNNYSIITVSCYHDFTKLLPQTTPCKMFPNLSPE